MNHPHFTVAELAARLQRTEQWVRDKAGAGEIPAFKIGSRWRFPRADIAKWEETKRNEYRDPWALSPGAAARRKSA